MSYQYGGIWCVVHIGELYNQDVAHSVRRNLQSFLGDYSGIDKKLKFLNNREIDRWIAEALQKFVQSEMNQKEVLTFSALLAKLRQAETRSRNQAMNFVPREDNSKGAQVYNKRGEELEARANQASKALTRVYRANKLGGKEQLQGIYGEMNDNVGYAIVRRGKVSDESIHTATGNLGNEHLRSFLKQHSKKLPLYGKGWSVIIAVAHPLAARYESKTAYPDKKYKGYNIMVLYKVAHAIALAVLNKLGHTSGKIRYGYILSRKGYEGKRLILE